MSSVIEELKKEAAFANRTSGTSRVPADWIFKLIAAYEAEHKLRTHYENKPGEIDPDESHSEWRRERNKLEQSADRAVRELEGE